MKILDWYIIKKYLLTFSVMLLLFIPIGIMVDISENIDKMLASEAPADEIVKYYFNFVLYFANLLFPIFLFLSVIWFTSKMANDTEIIAILSSGVSYLRFLRPFLIAASVVAIVAFVMGMYIVPNASKGFNEFRFEYIKKGRKELRDNSEIYKQITNNDFIYLKAFNFESKRGDFFTLEHFEDNKLEYKIEARSLKFNEEDSTYTMRGYKKRIVGAMNDSLISERKVDTIFPFDVEDLTPVTYMAETLNYQELNKFIEKERQSGSPNVSKHLLVKYKRWSLPITAFILTIIAVAVSSMKRRGGMGVNLAFGIAIAFIYIFFDKIFGTMAEKSGFSPMLAVWVPNIVFGVLAFYLLYNARR
ncbi:lipopolysaccharide export system permease protein [Kordia periserrulae]|uniref:Lipopolysaccharide export system permease protein n=1 Tax=Kordia periserrulae TaxID=701523 RepID=A0A2T6BUN1_9FLAO|nr:LptF/LptG family permease [Kordia periserrulae]PTX59791.1 lipopolysaccharide export system permease protein [Kordia periserrulae]